MDLSEHFSFLLISWVLLNVVGIFAIYFMRKNPFVIKLVSFIMGVYSIIFMIAFVDKMGTEPPLSYVIMLFLAFGVIQQMKKMMRLKYCKVCNTKLVKESCFRCNDD